MTDAELIAELERLNAERTRHAWIMDTKERIGENWMIGAVMDCGADSPDDETPYSDYIITTDCVHASELNSGGAKADAEFIVAVANALPRLLALAKEAERLTAANKALVEAAGPFAQSLVAQTSVEFAAQDWRDEQDDTIVFIRTSSQRKGLPELNDDATLCVGNFRALSRAVEAANE